ncbi:MAG: RNase adapter RapZ [Acidimicrobiia bacterium]|nr:RNase adapter RapZ [Acidimicrobiia bacterium]
MQADTRVSGRPQILVVTGMSGAGRSTAANVLEDLEYTVIDNLPPQFMSAVVDHHQIAEGRRRLAMVIDSRGGLPIDAIRGGLDELDREGISTLVVFLDAEDHAIIRRYEENRRPHPLRKASLTESIDTERVLLAELKDLADVVIDTTDLNVHQLRGRITDQFSEGSPHRDMRVSVTSFGFKHGIPRGSDLMFDVRFLPNPHWVPELRPYRGTDGPVASYVMSDPDATEFLDKVESLLSFLIPRFEAEGKSYLAIAIGCTGGHHRSVALAEKLGEWLTAEGIDATVRHRDIER